MARKRFSAEQIIMKLRKAEVLLAQGHTVGQVSRKLGITEQTCYRSRREYGRLNTAQAKKLKDLEKQKSHLKKLVSEAEQAARSNRRSKVAVHHSSRFE